MREANAAAKGVVAISLNRVTGGRPFFAESLADKVKLGEKINFELETNRWRWWSSISFDKSVAAVC